MDLADARLFKLTSLLFDAALGKNNYDSVSAVTNQIGIDAAAQTLGTIPLIQSTLGTSPTEQARALAQRLGLDPDVTDTTSADAIAYNFFKDSLESGMNVGTLALAAIRYLEQDNLPAGLDTAGRFLDNRAEAAYQYSTQLGFSGGNIQDLQAAIGSVDETAESIHAALSAASQNEFDAIRNSSTLTSGSENDDSIEGTSGSDYIDAGIGYDTVNGGAGHDILLGGSGDDVINGGKGQDSLEGGDGADILKAGIDYERTYHPGDYDENGAWVSGYYSYEFDAYYEILNGGSGHDSIYGGFGSDFITGGEGSDYIVGDEEVFYAKVHNSLSETIKTRMYNDTIDGGDGTDTIYGAAGNDSIMGGEGNDSIFGGDGNDSLMGEEGNDSIYAGDGADYVEGGAGDDLLVGGVNKFASTMGDETSPDTIYGNDGNDTIYASNGDNVDGGTGNDSIGFLRSDNGGHGVVIAGEGQDFIRVSNTYGDRITTALTIDLTEDIQVQDTVNLSVSARDPGVEIIGFDLFTDRIELGLYFDIYEPEDQSRSTTDNTQDLDRYTGDLIRNYLQIVNDTATPWQEFTYEYGSENNTPDSYGKAFFVIQDASIATSSASDAAALIDDYGNNATYAESAAHLFLVNIDEVGTGLYIFKDDTGANDRVVSDEIHLIGTLTGIYTEDITMDNANFII